MILCDPPYGTTACRWDSIIELDEMWKQYNRIIKDNGAIVLFSAQPFTTISGGLLVGIGLGIMFRSDASTGGTDLIALILSKKFPNFKVINLLSGLDGTIVIASGIVNNSIETALYSGRALLVIVKIADIIVEGFNSSRAFYIISDQPEKVRTAITGELNRG